ncbi:hypothetical protein NFI96_006276 [Prochilodus magdalenae]|nr:hypothetical protein NFI96_006276 [Prochilodus magdalenae]
MELERTISGFIRDELNTYKKHLTKKKTKYDGDVKDDKWNLRQAVLNMTQYFPKKMEHKDLADALQRIAQQGESTVLNKIYTELYITEGGAGQVNKDHEFQRNETLNDVSKAASLDVVMTNLIKGNLLPSARIWITTRPAAAGRIPAEYVHRMTELRGFTDEQKEHFSLQKENQGSGPG